MDRGAALALLVALPLLLPLFGGYEARDAAVSDTTSALGVERQGGAVTEVTIRIEG